MSVEENSLNVVITALCRQAMQHMSFKQATVTPSGGGPGNNFGDHCASSSSCKGTKRSTNNWVYRLDCEWKIKQIFKNKTLGRYLRLFFVKHPINISGGPHGTNDDYLHSLQSQPQGYHQNYGGNGRQCPAAAGNKNCDQFYTTSNISNHQSCCPFYSELV